VRPVATSRLTGTPSQVEWAERIKQKVGQEFDRVANAFRAVAGKQGQRKSAETLEILEILKEKREAVMSRNESGYFIRDWQELDDQVRKLISNDIRYQAIKQKREKVMSIRPLYDRIVVKRSEEQEVTRNGIFIPDSAKEKPQEGDVIAVGNGKRLENGTLVALDVKVGDHILFGKYSGSETKLKGTEYIIIREDDVLGILDGAANSAKN
jgi:chaperonin GroES